MATIEYTYTNRARCSACGNILWTTDNTCPVVCCDHIYTLTPTEIGIGLPISDAEHGVEVRKHLGVEDIVLEDTLILTKV